MKRIPTILTLATLLVFVWGCTSLEPESEQPEPELSITYHTPNPPTGAVLDSHTVHLSWERSGDVPEELEEHVQLLHIYQELALEECDAVEGTAEFQDLENRQYRWRVIGLEGTDTVGVSPDWEFEIDDGVTPPPAIRMIYPLDGDSLVGRSVRLQWEWTNTSRSKEEMRFRVHFGPSELRLPKVAEDLDVEELVVSPRESQRWYGWYVVATDSTGVSWVSKTQIFYLTARFDTTYGWCYRIQKEFPPCSYGGPEDGHIRSLGGWSDQSLVLRFGEFYLTKYGCEFAPYWIKLTVDNHNHVVQLSGGEHGDGGSLITASSEEFLRASTSSHKILVGHDESEGFYDNLDARIRIERLTSTNGVLWTHLFEDTSESVQVVDVEEDTFVYDLSGFNRFGHMSETSPGGAVVTGSVAPRHDESTYLIVYELDGSGAERWKRIYRSFSNVSGIHIGPKSGGYRVLAREFDEENETLGYWVWMISAEGDLLSRHSLSIDPSNTVRQTRIFADGGFGLLASSSSGYRLARFDENGSLLWVRDLGRVSPPQSVVSSQDEWVLLAEDWLTAYNGSGEVLWQR